MFPYTDNDASVIVRSRLALTQGHSYGPFRGRVKPLADDGELAFGAWMVCIMKIYRSFVDSFAYLQLDKLIDNVDIDRKRVSENPVH